jgi:hypothetical protein
VIYPAEIVNQNFWLAYVNGEKRMTGKVKQNDKIRIREFTGDINVYN